MNAKVVRVLCVDDNPLVAEGVRIKMQMDVGLPCFEWVGHVLSADDLVNAVRNSKADLVLLDIDMPGTPALTALADLAAALPSVRTIILSGYTRDDYLDHAVQSGAWGYVSKNDGPDQIMNAMRRVMNNQFAFGPTVLQTASTSAA